jgi:L-2-hydroxyglutarate oxidase LhgO
MDRVDALVIGAGVVGLAVARALALGGREVMVLEREAAVGTGTSSRNSEVIHAGIYYPAGSLKARLCVQGRIQLYAYCAERGIGHRRCGKLIVATTPSQLAALPAIVDKARANGVRPALVDQRGGEGDGAGLVVSGCGAFTFHRHCGQPRADAGFAGRP